MKYEENLMKVKKSSYSTKCLFGACDSCSRIANGEGLHDIVVYSVYKYKENELCSGCDGYGTQRRECPQCDGSGEIYEVCEDCNGKRKVPNWDSEKEYIGDQTLLKKGIGEKMELEYKGFREV